MGKRRARDMRQADLFTITTPDPRPETQTEQPAPEPTDTTGRCRLCTHPRNPDVYSARAGGPVHNDCLDHWHRHAYAPDMLRTDNAPDNWQPYPAVAYDPDPPDAA